MTWYDVGEDFLFYIHLSMWNALAILLSFLRAERVTHQRVLVVTILGFVHYAGGKYQIRRTRNLRRPVAKRIGVDGGICLGIKLITVITVIFQAWNLSIHLKAQTVCTFKDK
jgi:hypothetical protein